MPRLGKGWKELGFDTSPPREEPKDPKRVAEIEYGRRMGCINQWAAEGKLHWHAATDQFIVGGLTYGAEHLMDDVVFANIALGVRAGGGHG